MMNLKKEHIIGLVVAVSIGIVSFIAFTGNTQKGSEGTFNVGEGANIGTLDNSTKNDNTTTIDTILNEENQITENNNVTNEVELESEQLNAVEENSQKVLENQASFSGQLNRIENNTNEIRNISNSIDRVFDEFGGVKKK